MLPGPSTKITGLVKKKKNLSNARNFCETYARVNTRRVYECRMLKYLFHLVDGPIPYPALLMQPIW